MKAVKVVVDMRYKTEEGLVTQIDESTVGGERFIFTDEVGKQKLGKAQIHENGYNHPKLVSSVSGSIIDKGEFLYFIKGQWTYRLKRLGEAVLA